MPYYSKEFILDYIGINGNENQLLDITDLLRILKKLEIKANKSEIQLFLMRFGVLCNNRY